MYRTLAIAIGIGLWTLSSTSARADEVLLEQIYGTGVHAFNAGDFVGAHTAFTSAIKGGTNDPRTYYFRGLACLKLGREQDAKADFQKGAELESGESADVYPVARSLERIQGKPRQMLEQYRLGVQAIAIQRREAAQKQRYRERVAAEEQVLRTAPPRELPGEPSNGLSGRPVQPDAGVPAVNPFEPTPRTTPPAPAPGVAPAPGGNPFDPQPAAPAPTPGVRTPAMPAEDPFGGAATAPPATVTPESPFGTPVPTTPPATPAPATPAPPTPTPAEDPFGGPAATPAPVTPAPTTPSAPPADPFGGPASPAAPPADPFGEPATPPSAIPPAATPPVTTPALVDSPFGGPATPAPPAAAPPTPATPDPFGEPAAAPTTPAAPPATPPAAAPVPTDPFGAAATPPPAATPTAPIENPFGDEPATAAAPSTPSTPAGNTTAGATVAPTPGGVGGLFRAMTGSSGSQTQQAPRSVAPPAIVGVLRNFMGGVSPPAAPGGANPFPPPASPAQGAPGGMNSIDDPFGGLPTSPTATPATAPGISDPFGGPPAPGDATTQPAIPAAPPTPIAPGAIDPNNPFN